MGIFGMGRLQIFCLLAPLVVYGEDDGAVVEKRNVHHTSQHGHTHIQFGNSGVHHVVAPVALVPHHQVHHVSSSPLVRVPQHHAHTQERQCCVSDLDDPQTALPPSLPSSLPVSLSLSLPLC